jgi:hypothetical protein
MDEWRRQWFEKRDLDSRKKIKNKEGRSLV